MGSPAEGMGFERGEKVKIRRDCVGMVGKFPTPIGVVMMWDTGKTVPPVLLAESLALQRFALRAEGAVRKATLDKCFRVGREIATQCNVYPVIGTHGSFVGLAEDGRILITEPFYEEEEPEPIERSSQ